MSVSYKLETFEKDMPVCDFIEKYVRPEEFIEYCKACGNYGNVWSCPPYDFDLKASRSVRVIYNSCTRFSRSRSAVAKTVDQ